MLSKLSQWLVSDSGKKVSNIVAIGASLGAFAGYLVPQGYCIKNLKEWVQMYSHGSPTPLDEKVEARALEVLRQCNLREDEKKNFDFFTVYGLDIFSAGSTYTNWGAIIGLPSTFAYSHLSDVPRSTIQLRNVQEINWASPEGKQFQESMVLTENAQKFVIAREIYFCNNPTVFVYGFLATVAVSCTYRLSQLGNRKANLFQKGRSLRLILYAMSSSLGWSLFIAMKDAITIYWEKQSDKLAASIGDDFLQGGLEYYKSQQMRNIALRTLMGSYGESYFTAKGNECNLIIRTPTIPISTRIEYLKELLENKNMENQI